MITESFDNSKPIITPEMFYKSKEKLFDVCIITYSHKILNHVISSYKNEIVGKLSCVYDTVPIYSISVGSKKIGCCCSMISAPLASSTMMEISAITGAVKFIAFGSCGSLDREKTENRFVVPTSAYRDEGTSYHFLPASDYIDIKKYPVVSEVMKEMNLPFSEGKVWTTDAFYRETVTQFEARKKDGCIAVDMEVSGLQAVCDACGYEFYCFLEPGDVLSSIDYKIGDLSAANHRLHKFDIALKIAEKIS